MPLEYGRVGISLLAFSPDRLAGAGTYTLSLTRALTSRAPDRYTVFVPRQHERLWREVLPQPVRFVVCGPNPDRRIQRVIFEQVRLPMIARRHEVATVFFPHLFVPLWRSPRAVVTLYDLLLLSKRTDFAWHKRMYHRWAYRRLTDRAAHLVTISEFCRRDIMRHLEVPLDRISVVPPGLDTEFVMERSSQNRRLDLPDRYILSVAGAYPHKRLPTLVDTFQLLSNKIPDLWLVLAGTYAGERGAVRALLSAAESRGVRNRLLVLPRIQRSDMRELFARACALVSASEFEGFGIPIIEAMALGCPVAASPAEAVIEVLGGYGWVATDFSASALAAATLDALGARESATIALKQAMIRVRALYTWTASAATVEAALGS